MATLRNSNKHIAAREVRATPSAVAQAMLASSQDRGVVENSTSPVQNGYQDKSSVAEKSGRRPESALETNGNETFSEDTGFTDGSMASILLIEDDKETADEIRAELGDRGYVVDWAANGIEGLDKARSGGAEVVIVDRLLPGMDGLTIIEALRKEGMRTPV